MLEIKLDNAQSGGPKISILEDGVIMAIVYLSYELTSISTAQHQVLAPHGADVVYMDGKTASKEDGIDLL